MISALTPRACCDIRKNLKEMGISYRLLDEVILKTEAGNVLRCYDLLEDEPSKKTYFGIIRSRILGCDIAESFPANPVQYFSHPALQMPRPPEVFVDCGAYTGDTLEDLLKFKNGKIGKYIAFESDEGNYAKLCNNAEKLKKTWALSDGQLVLCNCAVGAEDGFSNYKNHLPTDGGGSLLVESSGEDVHQCKIVALDHFLHEKPTFLKADIESYEYSMLCGAEMSIRQYHPFCAISIYHNVVDLYSIPLLLHDFVPEYHFSIMHHNELFVDTVCYCWC